MATRPDNSWLENILHHVFLPPKLPGSNDERQNEWENSLTLALDNALRDFGDFGWPESELASIRLATQALIRYRSLNPVTWMISAGDLMAALKKLRSQEFLVPLYIGRQNAGIIIYSSEEHLFFETFELSPENQSVFTNNGRLRRDFPAATVSLPRDVLDREGFLSSISALIADMSAMSVPEMQPTIVKANEVQAEDRDTTKPHIVTQLLMAALRPFGELRRTPTPPLNDCLYKRFMVYFMARLLKLSLEADRPNDDIYAMNAKITRRLRKLGIKEAEPWMTPVYAIIRDGTAKLKERWRDVMRQDLRRLETANIFPSSLDQECKLSLPKLDNFISQLQQRATNMEPDTFIPSSNIMRVSLDIIPPPLQAEPGAYQIYNLVVIENWVAQRLPDWIKNHLDDPSSCAQLYSAMEDYFCIASTAYKSQPEGQSIMLLILLELWVACDRSAVAIYPLLRDYDPEVPTEICSSLLLRFRSQMRRLSAIERHVHERRQMAVHKRTSIFTTFGTKETFAARFYDSSSHHQKLLDRIESEAKEKEHEKRLEFRQLKKQYDALIAEAETMDHQDIMVTDRYGDQYRQHADSCRKCWLAKQADNMQIQIDEWPLPRDAVKAKSIVFELDIPSSFRHWRDGTYFLRKSVLGPLHDQGASNALYSHPLDAYQALTRFRSPDSTYLDQRVMPSSTTKPNAVTHRSGKKISDSCEDQVCLSNGMKWLYFDKEEDIFFQRFGPDIRIAKACTFLVPFPLQDFLHRPWISPDGLGPNKVIASQFLCPDHLSLDEFKALCSLPLGHKILWENILRQLAMPSVDWRKVETALFVLQISHQTGPFSFDSDLRSSHVGLEDEVFGRQLVNKMDQSLSRLKENWESVPAVATLIMVTARLLSLTRGASIQLCLSFLSSCRKTCFKWLQTLRDQVPLTRNTLPRQSLTRRILQAALAYACGDQWIEQASCWLKTTTSNQDGTVKVPVHYNVITAELLVKGLPLGRLPAKYEAHKDYTILFGRSSVDVMPSAEAGMKYSTRCSIQGYQIHLNYDSQRDHLSVRACKQETSWELVPSRLFEQQFPKHFSDQHVHWYNIAQGVVEFRPHSQPWTSDESSWMLRKQESLWVLQKSDTCLVGPFSGTANRLHEVFWPLEKRPALHIFYDKAAGSLMIEIPRLQLGFYINEGSEDIMSRQYRGMRVDLQQAIGTLIELANKLVLVKVGDNRNRLVLIPDCQPDYSRSPLDNHVIVYLDYSATRVQSYQLNHHLHRLTGNGSLESKLFLAEVHALTSGLIEDPFTLHTGTEEALTILRSAGVRSFASLSKAEIEILERIAALSPARNFYPAALKVMQVVDWDSRGLSPFSQHLDFSRLVRALFKQASETSFLYKDSINPSPMDWPHHDLEDREAIRSASFYKAGFGAEWHMITKDAPYKGARDRDQGSKRANRVSKVAAIFSESPVKLPFQISQDAARKIYAKLSGLPIINPKQAGVPKLSFNSKWVGNDGCLNLGEGHQVDFVWLRKCIERHFIDFENSIMWDRMQQRPGESRRDAFQRVEYLFKDQQNEFVYSLETHVRQLWPRTISDPANAAAGWTYLSFHEAMHQIRTRGESWHNNLLFLQSLEQACAKLRCITLSPIIVGPVDPKPLSLPAARNVHRYIQINDLFALTNTLEISGRDFVVEPPKIVTQTESSNEACLVSALGSQVAKLAKLPQEGRYVEQLAESIHQLGQSIGKSCLTVNGREQQALSEYYQSCLTQYNRLLEQIKKSLSWSVSHISSMRVAEGALNMGEGKSSVIVPIVAAALANGSNLVRVIVGKPQSRQMFEMLVSKLGGLMGSRVYHMPFSRSVRPSIEQAKFLQRHYQECRRQGGVLLLQPENILSFQLMVLEAAIKREVELSDTLLQMKANFFDEYSRDIIDESDENFSVRFELIYTIGLQTPVDYAPERWAIIQQILGLVLKYAVKTSRQVPKSVEVYISSQSKRPRIRFLDRKASDQVLGLVVDHICEYGLLPGFPVSRLSTQSRLDIQEYITNSKPSREVASTVEESDFWASSSQSLLLIRGLFAGSILDFVFSKKRWRVNYGLDRTREPITRLAVPYRAKDNPSQRSEFSQPDVVIALTSISYYYGGLTDEELFLSFSHLLKSDQADGEYQSWVQSIEKLPEAFRQLEGVNITDRQLCVNQLFPHLRYAKGVIDYFLSKIVFTKEMKEFPHKLSASGWDLGRIKKLPATGFSGTNDSQHVLPLTVKQLDLPAQKHTNALVLDNLMRPENSVTLLSAQDSHSAVWSAMQLLELTVTMNPEIRVILDVGVQIIDLSNKEVAKAWLNLVQAKQDIRAVVFCDDEDELSVLDRQGHIERLQTSPFAKHLDACLVFLDEAHTRGIDLRLPQSYRAAVTLGANLVKDRLVQVCMRMRKLGHGQSVVFYVPEEIETKVRALRTANSDSSVDEPITVLDVLAWSISETWIDIRRSFPIWATQGKTFARQTDYWESMCQADGSKAINKELAEKFLEEEAQTLERRYGLRPHGSSFIDGLVQSQNPMLREIFHRYSEFGNIDLDSSSLQEEQERELAPEVEEERQKERAKPAEPLLHKVHPDVLAFVRTGLINRSGAAFQPSFELFEGTSAAAELRIAQWPSGLLITRDFAMTVKPEDSPEHSQLDDFLRSVQWILTSSVAGKIAMVVISPFEANELRSEIAKSRMVVRHLYAARQNQGIAPIDSLDLYTLPGSVPRYEIPKRLIIELNLFAGQLYFRSFQEYTEVCNYLGLAWKAAEEGQEIAPDGFIQRATDDETCDFTASPVKFLKAIVGRIRFNCEGVEKTHLGKILEGALLTEDDFRGEL
ncbi:hypothetical protein V2G26_001625 [Clonostachys chloroleuca]